MDSILIKYSFEWLCLNNQVWYYYEIVAHNYIYC